MWKWLVFFLLLLVPAQAQFPVNGGRIDGGSTDSSTNTSIATGGNTSRTFSSRFAEQVNLLDYGGVGDGAGYTDAIMNASSSTVNSTHVTFKQADVGKVFYISGTGAAGVPQAGTITNIIDSHDVTVSFTAATSVTAQSFLYGTDNTTPFVNMMNKVNQAGPTSIVGYIPPGNFLMSLTGIPTLGRNGVVGAGKNISNIFLNPTVGGVLFSWSEAWGGVATGGVTAPGAADMSTPNNNNVGPILVGLTIWGSQTATSEQDAIVFYDRNDRLEMHDVLVQDLNGRCFSTGQTKNVSQAYLRESIHLELQCHAVGISSAPAVEISSTSTSGSDASNEIGFDDLHIFGAPGTGLAIRNPNNFSATRQINFGYLRIEKSGTATTADNFDIGLAGDAGAVTNVNVDYFESISACGSCYSFKINSSSGAHPGNIKINHTYIFSGISGSLGINVQDGSQIAINAVAITVNSTNVTVGSGITGYVTINGYGNEAAWTTSIDTTKAQFIRIGSALPYVLSGPYQSGRFYSTPVAATPANVAVTTANRLFATPFFVGVPSLVKSENFDIGTGNGSGFHAEMCIYADSGNGGPGALVANTDSGSLTIGVSVTGVQTFSINSGNGVVLPGPAWYWTAFEADSTAESVFSTTSSLGISSFTTAALGTTVNTSLYGGTATSGLYMTNALGTCPGTFSASPTLNTGAATPLVELGF